MDSDEQSMDQAHRPLPAPISALMRQLRARPLAADAALAVGLGMLTVPDTLRDLGATAGAAAVQIALWLPVAFRRRAPVLAFLFGMAAAAVQWSLVRGGAGDFAVLVLLYSVAAHRIRITAVAAAIAVQAGGVAAILRLTGELWPRALLLLTALTVGALVLGITQQARRSHLKALIDRADRMERERDQQGQLATAAERSRIAREMHDIVAHSLAVIITLADGAVLTDRPGDARVAMQQVARTGRDALADTRRVLGVLRLDEDPAERAPLPGLAAVEQLLTTIRATGLSTELTVVGSVFPLPEAAQTAVFRIIQEALTNTLKHGHEADRARVRLEYDEPQVTVEVVDNGEPPATNSPVPAASDGHGLVGLRERAALFDGTVEAGPRPGRGWRVCATLRVAAPLQDQPIDQNRSTAGPLVATPAVPRRSDPTSTIEKPAGATPTVPTATVPTATDATPVTARPWGR